MRYVIVTGMSGAGKSTALNMLEDAGYYCVDNLPIQLIEKFAELTDTRQDTDIRKVAIGVDIRSGDALFELDGILERLRERQLPLEILFLDASDECLVKRYKETRRNHPLAFAAGGLDAGIKLEREKLDFLRKKADYILDTSMLLTRELKEEMEKIFVHGRAFNNLFITIVSFGFKFGLPSDADLIFDVRFLPNPYYVDSLRKLTGNDEAVRNYVMNSPASVEFMEHLGSMVEFLIPNYIKEGRSQLVIGIGCTGGKHRSVTIANQLYERLQGGDYGLRIEHRSIAAERIRKGEV